MIKHNKVLKLKLRLTPTQEAQLLYQASLVRHIFNWALSRRIEVYKTTDKGLTYNQQSAELTAYKQANKWLYDAPANSLQYALKDVAEAFKNFFEKRARFPKFKAKGKSLPKVRFAKTIDLQGNRLKLPKLGWVRCLNRVASSCFGIRHNLISLSILCFRF
jgi:putative transposase